MPKSWKRQALGKIEYDSYELTIRELVICLLKSAALTAVFSYMFYRSWLGALALPAVAVFCIKREIREKTKQRKQRLAIQFKDAIEAVTSALQAGYSVENAFLEAEGEIRSLYGTKSEMFLELATIRKGLKNSVPLEMLLKNLGERSHVEEIRDFGEVFGAAKRTGGNLPEIIRRTTVLTQQRLEVEREIITMLAAQKYEQKVMNLIPFLLFGYMQLTSGGFFDVLYGNAAGIAIMTLALIFYLGAWALSEKMLDIRV